MERGGEKNEMEMERWRYGERWRERPRERPIDR